MKADYPYRFINSVINEFQRSKGYGDESFIITPDLTEITKPFTSIEIPYCKLSDIKIKTFSEEISQIH